MTISDALKLSHLPAIDKELMLAHVLKVQRTKVLSHAGKKVTAKQLQSFQKLLTRREAGEPIAYITNEKEFYGRSFFVNPSVLIPRPATEGLIDLTLNTLKMQSDEMKMIDSGIIAISHIYQKETPAWIVDIGTGSGCIAVTLCLEQSIPIIATDTSAAALKVARKNAKALKAKVKFLSGDLLEPLKKIEKPFFVVSNLPYIPTGTPLDREVKKFEPPLALFGGPDGLLFIKDLLHQCGQHPHCMGIALECRADQEREVRSFF